ncbi:MAG: Amuc_1100 family pilus-like protein, partial [Roseibacillus sp.]
MGDWIKENKFEAGMLVAVVLISIVAYLFGGKRGAAYQEHKEYYGVAANTVTQLRQKKPFPNPDNVDKYQAEIDGYRTVIEDLQGKLLAYRPAEFKKILPSEFIDRLNAARTKLAGEFTANGIEFPDEKWYLGFESYTGSPPRDDATKYLNYQLDALTSLFESLAVSKPSALVNVYRQQMPVEKGQPMDGGGIATPKPRRGKTRSPRQAATTPPPFYRLPLELTFKAQEPAARKFIAAV